MAHAASAVRIPFTLTRSEYVAKTLSIICPVGYVNPLQIQSISIPGLLSVEYWPQKEEPYKYVRPLLSSSGIFPQFSIEINWPSLCNVVACGYHPVSQIYTVSLTTTLYGIE